MLRVGMPSWPLRGPIRRARRRRASRTAFPRGAWERVSPANSGHCGRQTSRFPRCSLRKSEECRDWTLAWCHPRWQNRDLSLSMSRSGGLNDAAGPGTTGCRGTRGTWSRWSNRTVRRSRPAGGRGPRSGTPQPGGTAGGRCGRGRTGGRRGRIGLRRAGPGVVRRMTGEYVVGSYYAGKTVGRAFQPDGISLSGWKARPT